MTKRESAIIRLRIAGYHNDSREFVSAYVENRISREVADKAWQNGQAQREAGVKCGRYACKGTERAA
ncbi:MAG: hypothetical protein EBS50_12265 [Sphingomonadaceae bacterium]|nr:hypothetical protein [Sphingomonadaceae bacterium]